MEKAQGLEELIKFSNLRFDIASLHIHDFCYQTMPMYRMITDDIEERMGNYILDSRNGLG
jgi:hypothetical protein